MVVLIVSFLCIFLSPPCFSQSMLQLQIKSRKYNFERMPLVSKETPAWVPLHLDHRMYLKKRKGGYVVDDPSRFCYQPFRVRDVFLLQDVPELGHMHQTFMTFFSYLSQQLPHRNITAVWEKNLTGVHPSNRERYRRVRTALYGKLLEIYMSFFSRHLDLRFTIIDPAALDAPPCIRAGALWSRSCIMPPVPPLIQGTAGNCGNWFSDAFAVGAFRAMLAEELQLGFPTHNCQARRKRLLYVLIYSRPHARAWKDAEKVRRSVYEHLRRLLVDQSMVVSVHSFLETDFTAQCHLFHRYDLILMVHGAAMAHLVCARPCASVIEVGWWYNSTFRILAGQLGLPYCFASVHPDLYIPSAYARFRESVQPSNLTACLDEFAGRYALRQGEGGPPDPAPDAPPSQPPGAA